MPEENPGKLRRFLSVLKVLGPAVLAVVPGAQPFIPLIIAGIQVAEETGKPGAEKRQIALDAVVLGAEAANLAAKRVVVPVDDAVNVAADSIDAIVGTVNLVGKIKDNVGDNDPTE